MIWISSEPFENGLKCKFSQNRNMALMLPVFLTCIQNGMVFYCVTICLL